MPPLRPPGPLWLSPIIFYGPLSCASRSRTTDGEEQVAAYSSHTDNICRTLCALKSVKSLSIPLVCTINVHPEALSEHREQQNPQRYAAIHDISNVMSARDWLTFSVSKTQIKSKKGLHRSDLHIQKTRYRLTFSLPCAVMVVIRYFKYRIFDRCCPKFGLPA